MQIDRQIKKKFNINPLQIRFDQKGTHKKFSVKNTSLKTQSYEIVNPNQDHYKIQSSRKFSLAPGMSKSCTISHLICDKCNKDQFNKLRITSLEKQTILVNLSCPQNLQEQIKLIQFNKEIDFGQFNFQLQKKIDIPISNITDQNLKLSIEVQSDQDNIYYLTLQDTQIILLKDRSTHILGAFTFKSGAEFDIKIFIKITSEEDVSHVKKIQKIHLKGNALAKSQIIKNANGFNLETLNLKVLNGTSLCGQFFLQNNFRKDCKFKIIPQMSSSSPNQFANKWIESEITFSQQIGVIKSFETKRIKYQIKTSPNANDINFIQKFSKIDFSDQFSHSKMKVSKYFKKSVQINVKAIFTQNESSNQSGKSQYHFKMRVTIINPALKINYRSEQKRQIFQIQNDSQIYIPFHIQNHSLYKASPNKGVFEEEVMTIVYQWKAPRPKSGIRSASSTFSLTYGKCDLILGLPKCDLQIYNFLQKQNLRPASSTMKKNLGLQRSSSAILKRPMSAICTQMISKKLKLVHDHDFYKEIPKFMPVQKIPNDLLEKLVSSSGQKGNILSNAWNKQISVYFPQKGYLILKPLTTYLLTYQLNLSTFYINDQQFMLHNPLNENILSKGLSIKEKRGGYTLASKQLFFSFSSNKKQYEIQNALIITNISKQVIKAFLLTLDDQYFISSQDSNKIIIKPQQSVSFRLKFSPKSYNKGTNQVKRILQVLINGQTEEIICHGELLPAECDYLPKQLKFIDCHYGQGEMTQNIVLSNTGVNKFSYQVTCPQHVSINSAQSYGQISGKSNTSISIKFKPYIYLQNYKNFIAIAIRGSHIIYVPFIINIKKPDVTIIQNHIDFGQALLGDIVQSNINVLNRNRTQTKFQINLENTLLKLENGSCNGHFSLKPQQKLQLTLKTKVTEVGYTKIKLSKQFAEIPGFGKITCPTHMIYKGRQNILQLTPSQMSQSHVIEEMQQTFKIKFKSLINQIIQLKIQLVADVPYPDTFIFSAQPNTFILGGYLQKQISLRSLIADLEKLTQQQRKYSLKIYLKGESKPYTIIKINLKLPTPKLIVQPKQLYFPIVGINNWNHATFKIINKGYKQIHFKIKKPSQINFELETLPKVLGNTNQDQQNKLTKLHNEAQVRVSFKSKSTLSFQNYIQVQDNMGNSFTVKIFGLISSCPLLVNQLPSKNSLISAKSLPSMVSMPVLKTNSRIQSKVQNESNEEQQIQHAKFFNYWIGTFMPHMRKQTSINQFLVQPSTLLEFLQYFTVDLTKCFGKEIPKLKDIIFQLRKLEIPLDLINIQLLQKSQLSQWNKFILIFLSKKYVHHDCLKWISKTLNQTYETYQSIYANYKKVIAEILNVYFAKVLNSKITQFQKLIERMDPFLEFLYKIQNKKHLIISLNILYYKLSNSQTQTIKTEQLYSSLKVTHSLQYQKTVNWIINDRSPQISGNLGGSNIHTNLSGYGYYFNLDKSHPETEIKLGLKQKTCIAILNSTLFQKCYFINYDLQEIQPKYHNVVIQCQDKYSQQWVLDYQAPLDSQYKIQFTGDPQFKSRFSVMGQIKTGKTIPITISYSPNNLNAHTASLTILNKHFAEIYQIKGKALFSQNIQFQRQIKIYQGRKHCEIIQIPWEYVQQPIMQIGKKQDRQIVLKEKENKIITEIPNLTVNEYNQKRTELISSNVTVQKQSKKQFLVKLKLEYLFERPLKKLVLLYQIINQDQTQSKIIRLVIKVVPKPITIQAQIRCKLEQTVIQKIPLQNISQQKELVNIQFFKNNIEVQRYDKIQQGFKQQGTQRKLKASSLAIDNQLKLNKIGKIFLQPNQLENILLTYKPDSLYQTACQVRVVYQQSQNVINYKFRGIPEFPSSLQDKINITCMVEQIYPFMIHLKSLVRQQTTFEVQTNVRQVSGKQKVILGSGQSIDYPLQAFSYHPGVIYGQIRFNSSEITMIYPICIKFLENPGLAKNYNLISKVRNSTILQIELQNKSTQNISYDIICDHQYLICPQKFEIERLSKKILEITYLPFKAGNYKAKVKLFNPLMKEIIYHLQMNAQPHEQLVQGQTLGLLTPHIFILPIKNKTHKACMIEKPILPQELSLKNQALKFPLMLEADQCIKLELTFQQKNLNNIFQEAIIIKTDCIGDYKFICKLQFFESKNMDTFYIHYQAQSKQPKLQLPFKMPFLNGFNQKLVFNLACQGLQDSKIPNAFDLQNPSQITLKSFQSVDLQGTINIMTSQIASSSKITSSGKISSINLIASTFKDKTKFDFVFPIKLIKIHQSPVQIVVKANAYQMTKSLVVLTIVKEISNWSISNMDQDFAKASFNFNSVHSHQNYLSTVINKPFKYEGFITFYDLKNQAQKVALKINIGQPRYQTVVISSNVGEKAVVQIQLKNGKGSFQIQLANNKTQQFQVQPKKGEFEQIKSQSIAKINFIYHPTDYSGIKKAKVTVISQQGNYYFNLIGKFKNTKQKQVQTQQKQEIKDQKQKGNKRANTKLFSLVLP